MGLAICKGLVEAHGGRIRAASGGQGAGARFTFTVPVAGEPSPAESADSALGSARALRHGRERVLVVDDDPQTLLHIRNILTAAGYDTLSTGDHRELSGVIHAENPHLVLLDLMLPGTDGIRLMEQVPELADMPVIFALRGRAGPERFELEELSIDYDRRRVTVAGRPVELTATEYELLRVLSANAGRVLTYRSLLRQAWSRHPGGVNPKLVHAVVKRLRGKLGEDGSRAAWILNERGVGYRMPAPPGK